MRNHAGGFKKPFHRLIPQGLSALRLMHSYALIAMNMHWEPPPLNIFDFGEEKGLITDTTEPPKTIPSELQSGALNERDRPWSFGNTTQGQASPRTCLWLVWRAHICWELAAIFRRAKHSIQVPRKRSSTWVKSTVPHHVPPVCLAWKHSLAPKPQSADKMIKSKLQMLLNHPPKLKWKYLK